MSQKFFLIALTLILGLVSQPVHANKLLEFFFPSLKKEEYDPTKTLKAPFAYEDEDKAKEDAGNADKTPLDIDSIQASQKKDFLKAVPLEKPHRLDNEIGAWVTDVISEIITFEDNTYSATIEKNRSYFNARGYLDVQKFFDTVKIKRAVESGEYEVHGFVEDIPVVLNTGNLNGSYKWLFNVPVMVSYIKKDAVNYRKSRPVNQDMTLVIQVGRHVDADNEHGLFIETWSGKMDEEK